MVKMLLVLVLVGFVSVNGQYTGNRDLTRFQGKYVYDLLKPALQPDEVVQIEATRGVNAYPTYNMIPSTRFSCSSKAGPGFYADTEAGCQVFHRCDLQGNQTDYLCVNTTVFNQITLVCDNWYDVDCGRSLELENFANSRLYTDQPLFDTPPSGYIAPSQAIAQTVNVAQVAQPSWSAPAPAPAPRRVSASGNARSSGSSNNRRPAAARPAPAPPAWAPQPAPAPAPAPADNNAPAPAGNDQGDSDDNKKSDDKKSDDKKSDDSGDSRK